MANFEKFEEKMNIDFKDKTLLEQAFTHRSFLNENRNIERDHNERLEFLGDAVLELAVTEHLYKTFAQKPEGELTSLRAALVNTSSLSTTASELGMNDFLLLSKGEAKDTGRARQYILANTFEAVVGAIYLDKGYDEAAEFIAKTIFDKISEIVKHDLWQDAKSKFQEMAQEKVSITPTYETLKEEGPDHDRHFTVGVFLEDEMVASGEGKSKQEAAQIAAQKGLEKKGWK